MTRDQFIKVIEKKSYSYRIERDLLVVTGMSVDLNSLTSLPSYVMFKNQGNVFLNNLTSLPSDVHFNNEGNVSLDSLTSLSSGVVFENYGNVYLYSLISIESGVFFKNKGYFYDARLNSLTGDWFKDWSGNIEGVNSTRLLNFMISKELLNKSKE